MICNLCGKRFEEGTAFCDNCGNALVPENNVNTYQNQAFQAQNYQSQPQAFQPQPYQMYQHAKESVSVGGYIGRTLINYIPFVGPLIYFIMLFVWAGDTSKEDSFRNWAKAQLWVILISVAIALVSVILIAIIGGTSAIALFDALFSGMEYYY